MIFAILLALTGLTLSAVAIYYSVIGLTAVFAASFWAVAIMGTTLEVSKLVAASWLKAYWERIPRGMKIYMSIAVVVLMIITSMGIFGFLSKAHLDQNIISGDVQSKIAIYDEKIQTERENIDAARKALAQMDAQVNERLSRSTDDRGAERAVQIRRQQQAERTRLQNDISRSQNTIARLNEERAPIAAEVRKVEAEVGPIKYIAKLIYGDNPDANLLEKAVTWVIMIIVFVFDPLAVLMLLGAQMTYRWHKEEKSKTDPTDEVTPVVPVVDSNEPSIDEINAELASIPKEEPTPESIGVYPEYKVEDADEEPIEDQVKKEIDPELIAHARQHIPDGLEAVEAVGVETWNKMIEEAEQELLREKDAMRQWKLDNPDSTIKHQEKLLQAGLIDELPWKADSEESKKKTTYIVKQNNQQITKTKE